MPGDDQDLRKHKNIVKYIHSIRTDTHLNIVLEYVEGLEFEGIGRRAVGSIRCAGSFFTCAGVPSENMWKHSSDLKCQIQ